MTAPGIGPWIERGPQSGGVEMEIAHQFQQVGVAIAENRLIAPLKHVAGLVVSAIVVLAVCELQRLHRPRERMGSGLQQQMDVVGHQDVGMEGDAVSAAIAFEALQIAGVIFGIMKDRCPLVATDDHMIEGAWKIDARLASHGGVSRFRENISQYSCLTPYR